jgi:hypothetical protein
VDQLVEPIHLGLRDQRLAAGVVETGHAWRHIFGQKVQSSSWRATSAVVK